MVHSAAATCASRFAGPSTVTAQRSRVRARWVPEQSQMPQQRPLLNLARASEYLGDWAGFEPLHRFPKGYQPTEGLDHQLRQLATLTRLPVEPAHLPRPLCAHLFISWRALSKLNSLVTCSCKSQPGPKKWKMRSALSPQTDHGEFLVIRRIVRLWVT